MYVGKSYFNFKRLNRQVSCHHRDVIIASCMRSLSPISFDRSIVRLNTTIQYNRIYYMYDKPRFDMAMVYLHSTISYNICYRLYDKPRFDRTIVHLHTIISYNILYYMYNKPLKQLCIILYAYVKYV